MCQTNTSDNFDEIVSTDIAIIGAGPTGIGAASRLVNLSGKFNTQLEWQLYDESDRVGGLATTDVTNEGFLFDVGGHVIFSHYKYFDELIDAGVGQDGWNEHERVCYVWLKDRWIPYPFQNNLFKLDREDQINCINGVINAATNLQNVKPTNFDEWIVKVMGEGIANIFMRPYNFKVWAYPTTTMQCEWLGERVATVNPQQVITNVLNNVEAAGWGPNATFRFPKEGGTGGIWTRVGDKVLDRNRINLKSRIEKIMFEEKALVVRKEGGQKVLVKYNKLLNTSPLDLTLEQCPDGEMQKLSKNLNFSTTHVIGIGLRGVNPHDTKCWLYFPEDNCNFYRATIFSLYADGNVPSTNQKLPTRYLAKDCYKTTNTPTEPIEGPYWSVMLEVSESAEHKPVNIETIIADTIQGCINTKLISGDDQVVSTYYRSFYRGYPTPHVNRDGVVNKVLPVLKEKYSIWNRGRFGSWKYEVGNQDHSVMLGVEAIDNMLFGAKEFTLEYPNQTNGKKNMEMSFA